MIEPAACNVAWHSYHLIPSDQNMNRIPYACNYCNCNNASMWSRFKSVLTMQSIIGIEESDKHSNIVPANNRLACI